ncbi:unnamed protein product, partial [Amoebophrya sp. A25]
IHGENVIDVECKHFAWYLRAEFGDFTTLFQLHCLWAPSIFTNWMLAIVCGMLSLIFGIANAITARKNQLDMQKMVSNQGTDKVLFSRYFDIAATSAGKLVPGDLIEIDTTPGWVVPCDCVVLSGGVVVNESNLTGEAMPIQKFALEDHGTEALCLKRHGKKNILFAGTTVMQSRRNCGGSAGMKTKTSPGSGSTTVAPAIAVVLATGAQTAKGHMIRSILYAGDIEFELYRQLPIAIVIYGTVAAALMLGTTLAQNDSRLKLVGAFFEAVCILSRLVTPMIRVGFKIAQRNAAKRMRETSGYAIQSLCNARIPVAGRLQIQCFDKTGTLTEENLNFHGVERAEEITSQHSPALGLATYGNREQQQLHHHNSSSSRSYSGNFHVGSTSTSRGEEKPRWDLVDVAASTCHTVTRLHDGSLAGNKVECELVTHYGVEFRAPPSEMNHMGDELEQKHKSSPSASPCLLEFYRPSSKSKSVACASATTSSKPYARTLRQFEFDQKIQLQSVIVEYGGARYLFTKGSPAKVAARCRPDSLPDGFSRYTQNKARQGYYLLALACKKLGDVQSGQQQERNGRSSSTSFNDCSREQLECDLSFLGLLYFRNCLKPCTTSAIEELAAAGVKSVMITGDNVWNGLHIAKKCTLIAGNQKPEIVWTLDSDKDEKSVDEQGPHGALDMIYENEAEDAARPANNTLTTDEVTALLASAGQRGFTPSSSSKKSSLKKDVIQQNKIVFGVTQAAWSHLRTRHSEELKEIFPHIVVYGGMSPSGKVEVVTRWSESKVVGMCGDGGNDCAALKAAHVGLALVSAGRTTEVSIVSPFSRDEEAVSIHAVVELVREGRCTLENSVATYKFFTMCGLLSAISKMLLSSRVSYFSEMHFLFQDCLFLVLLTYAIASCKPAKKLAPFAPTANILGWEVLGSIALPTAIYIGALLLTYWSLGKQNWFRPPSEWELNIDVVAWWHMMGTQSSMLTSQWLLFAGCGGALLYSLGGQHRRCVLRNWFLIGTIVATVGLLLSLLFFANTGLNCIFRTNCEDAQSWETFVWPF